MRLGPATSTVTDDEGAFALEAPTGAYTASVTADGYAPITRDLELLAGATTSMEVSLERAWGPETGGLDVAVTGAGGGETIPCEITLFGDETERVTAPEGAIPDGETWTDPLTVSEGWWELRVSNAEGYGDGTEEVYVPPGETAFAWVELAHGDEEIPETGRLEGRVVDDSGAVVDDPTVRVNGDPVSIDDAGRFERELPHGRHEITASAPGYGETTDEVPVKFGRTTEWTVVLESR